MEIGHNYDVTVTSYLGCWYLLWYAWKEEAPAISWYQLSVPGVFIFKFTGRVVTLPHW